MGRTPEQVSQVMRRVKSRDTQIELLFRRAIWKQGLRYRVCDRRLPGSPDLVFPAKKLIVFVDGDFWHGNQWRRRGLSSLDEQFAESSNAIYWIGKLRRTIARDFRTTQTLRDDGWSVLRFWESDLNDNLEECVQMTLNAAQSIKSQSKKPETDSSAFASSLTVAEFFAGIGLVRLGLEPSWRVIFANDMDEKKHRMYADNFDAEHYLVEDIHKLSPSDVPSCTLFTASFPCNDLSVAGSMKGLKGNHSSAFWGLIDILKAMKERKPPLVLLENVTGFLTSHQGQDFEAALRSLNELGYACDAFILNASSWVPQSRARLFVVAQLDADQPEESFWKISDSAIRPKSLVDFIYNHPGIHWKIRNLPQPPTCAESLESIVEPLPEDDPIWWNRKRTDYFMGQLSPRHRKIADEMIRSDCDSYGTAFRRVRHGKSMAELRVDGIAGCLRTPRGGSGRQILFKAGHGRHGVRLLNARECARLQGVDDSYKIDVPLTQALFGFGDAVCVPAIQWISNNYLIPVATEMMRGALLPATPESH